MRLLDPRLASRHSNTTAAVPRSCRRAFLLSLLSLVAVFASSIPAVSLQGANPPREQLGGILLRHKSVFAADFQRSLAPDRHEYLVRQVWIGSVSPGDRVIFIGDAPEPWRVNEAAVPEVLWLAKGPRERWWRGEVIDRSHALYPQFTPIPASERASVARARFELFEKDMARELPRVRAIRAAEELTDPTKRKGALLAALEDEAQPNAMLECTFESPYRTDGVVNQLLAEFAENGHLVEFLEVVARQPAWIRFGSRDSGKLDLTAAASDSELSDRHRGAALFFLQNQAWREQSTVELLPLLSSASVSIRRSVARLMASDLRPGRSPPRCSEAESRQLIRALESAWKIEQDPLARSWMAWALSNGWDHREEQTEASPPPSLFAIARPAPGGIRLRIFGASAATADLFGSQCVIVRGAPAAQRGRVVFRETLATARDRFPEVEEITHWSLDAGLGISLDPGRYSFWIEGAYPSLTGTAKTATAPTLLVMPEK